jgi:hypothetical protein
VSVDDRRGVDRRQIVAGELVDRAWLNRAVYEPFAPSSVRWRFQSAETDLWGMPK